MPSDLQRVARGLVECLDEVPQVVLHLQRTADRCRENAALAIVASQGRATVAAQQLDAAARACEAAAHYLSMAPPKAKAWAERLVGEGRSTSRPDSSGSADRNKATGGVAERDSRGRTRRLEARFKPGEEPEAGEAPLIRVARKAFEELRKKQEKDAEEREKEQPEEGLEVELVVDPKGELRAAGKAAGASSDEDEREEPAYEIAVDLGDAARELLEAMAASGEQAWERAELVIAVDRMTATFEYGEDAVVPEAVVPVVDVELPEFDAVGAPEAVDVPALEVEVGETEFDPAFEPRALGVDFAPGVHDPGKDFLPKEVDIAERLELEGWRIDARPEDHGSGEKNPDAMVRKDADDRGSVVEFKRLDSRANVAVRRNVNDAADQADEAVIDGRKVDLGFDDALRGFRRACGQQGKTVPSIVHFILGDGRLITYEKEH